MTPPACRFCGTPLETTFVDLGATPLANSYVTDADIAAGRDRAFPLHARVCASCFLVQVDDPVRPDDIFSDYAYFSSVSSSWVEHARAYAQRMAARFGLGAQSRVIEVASNDGYLLQHFVRAGIPVLGVEPAANVAPAAVARGVPTEVAFFGRATARSLAERGLLADLTAANNVLAHVPDILDFVAGFATILKPEGVATFEFPHLLALIEEVQFDTIYHEHFSYLSLVAVENVFARAGLRAFDVEHLPTHGGSLRLFACRAEAAHHETEALRALRAREHAAGLDGLEGYRGFAPKVEAVKAGFHAWLAGAKREGRNIAAYGAAAKGNTFLNVCGVTEADIPVVFDKSPAKQGRRLPGSHLPILAPERIAEMRPAEILVLPWNLLPEISRDLAFIADWGGRLVTAIPELRVHGAAHPSPLRERDDSGRQARAGVRGRARLGNEPRMIFTPTLIPGCVLVAPEPRADERGSFARLFCPEEFAAAGHPFTRVQASLSRNPTRHTLRGLHWQDPPHAESKLVRVTRGRVYDVVVDLRPDSATCRRWVAVELDTYGAGALLVPAGCAHGFLTLEPDTDVLYEIDRAYVPGQARGARFDDPAFGIDWPAPPALIGAADLAWPAWKGTNAGYPPPPCGEG